MNIFSSRLKALLSEKGVTQEVLANKLFTTQQTVSRWINGINEPDCSTLVKIADNLGCTLDYLLGREDDYDTMSTTSNLTTNQNQLLSSFNLLSQEDQNKVIGFVKALEKN